MPCAFWNVKRCLYGPRVRPRRGRGRGGVDVAGSMGEDPACVYKTLVTQGSSKNYFVFVIPVAAELDLKAAARSVGEKSVAMIHVATSTRSPAMCAAAAAPWA